MARSLNWSTTGKTWAVSTRALDQVAPPSVEWETWISESVPVGSNWVTETYRAPAYGLVGLSSTCSQGLSVSPPEKSGVTATAGALHLVPLFVDFSMMNTPGMQLPLELAMPVM